MGDAPHYYGDSSIVLNIMQGLDDEKHNVVAFITCTEPLPFFCVAPFVLVFQFSGDKTVYAVCRNDLAPEFSVVDYVRWFLNDENLCCSYCLVEWFETVRSLESNEKCAFCLCSGDPTSTQWNCLKMFMEMYFPGCGKAFGLTWTES